MSSFSIVCGVGGFFRCGFFVCFVVLGFFFNNMKITESTVIPVGKMIVEFCSVNSWLHLTFDTYYQHGNCFKRFSVSLRF